MSQFTEQQPRRGRRPDGVERVKVCLSVRKDCWEEFERRATARSVTYSDVFNTTFKPRKA